MITASAEFITAVGQTSRTFRAKLLYNSTEVTGDIRKLIIYKGSCGATEFRPGAVFSSYVEAAIDHCTTSLEGKELELQIGLMTGGTLSSPTFEYITIGYFIVGKPKTSVYRTTFTAYGPIQSKLNEKLFISTATGLLTVGDTIDLIEQVSGVDIETGTGVDRTVELSSAFLVKCMSLGAGITCREALEAVAFVIGGYAAETNDGKIWIDKYSTDVTASYSAGGTMTEMPEFHDYDTEITGVQVAVSESVVYSSGTPINLETDSTYITENAFDVFADNLIGLTYRGGTVPIALGDPRLEAWDTLRITDIESNTFDIPCMAITITFDGGLQTLIEAPSVEPNISTIEALGKSIAVAKNTADAAQKTADDAKKVATNYLSADSTGIMVADLQDGTKTPSAATGRNVFIDNDSVNIRDGQSVLASFGETVEIGKSDGTQNYIYEDYRSLRMTDNSGRDYVYFSDLRNKSNKAEIIDEFFGDGETTVYRLSFVAQFSDYEIVVSDSSGGAVTKTTVAITFEVAPTAGATITVTYVTVDYTAKAYTLGFRKNETNVGAMSYAFGNSVEASGVYSHAEGYNTAASGGFSHAEGRSTLASGTFSHTEGDGTVASSIFTHAEGWGTTASGTGSHAEGYNTTANNIYSHAEGNGTVASGEHSHSEGSATTASGFAAHTEGYNTAASGSVSHAEGYNTAASGSHSHAEGQSTTASGSNSHAEGQSTTASGNWASHSEGYNTTASGETSHAEGYNTTASGNNAHAEGWLSQALSSQSHAEGYNTRATNTQAHAEGYGTRASGWNSHAQNYYTKAASNHQTALGKYNIEDSSNIYAVIIGNGTDDNARSNAFALTWDGNVHVALDTSASSGTTDADLYDAICALGWESDVIN